MRWRDEWWIHTPRDFEWRYDPPDIQAGAASASEIHWRFRVDDQSDPDNGTNWHAAEDTNASGVNAIDVDTDFIVRFKIDETETKDWDPGTNGLTMQYRHVQGANTWVTIDPTTDNVVRASSGTGGSPTLTNDSTVDTERLTSGTGSYVSGGASTDGTLSTTITKGDYTEVEFCVFVRGTEVTDADTIDFRLQSAGATLVNLGTPPQIEVNKTAVDPVWDQDSFRVGNDDGSESAYNFKRAANTNWTQRVDSRFLIRFLVQETAGATASPTLTLQLQYNKNSGGWNDVTGASSNVRAEASANLTEGGDTTQRIGAGTFLTNNNWVDDNDGLTAASGGFAGNDEAEALFSIFVRSADVADDDTIQLRVIESPATALDTYTNTPTLTVTKQTEELKDPLTLTENLIRTGAYTRDMSDALTLTENLVRTGVWTREMSDSIPLGTENMIVGTTALEIIGHIFRRLFWR